MGINMRNRAKTATPTVQTYIDEKSEEVSLTDSQQETTHAGDIDDSVEGVVASAEPDEIDDSWLDDLTPYESEQQDSGHKEQQENGSKEQQQDSGSKEQQQRLAELYANFEHVDEDVASELDSKLLAPIRAEVNELKLLRQQEQQRQQSLLLANANNKIIAKYPKAEKILRSKQFRDFVNADNDPYSTEQAFDRIMRAYYAGDGDYVVKQLDIFVESRGKPKPPVGVEPHQGSGGSSVGNVSAKRLMTEAEYLAKRQAIKAAPRGTYPPNALKQLAEQYQQSRG